MRVRKKKKTKIEGEEEEEESTGKEEEQEEPGQVMEEDTKRVKRQERWEARNSTIRTEILPSKNII